MADVINISFCFNCFTLTKAHRLITTMIFGIDSLHNPPETLVGAVNFLRNHLPDDIKELIGYMSKEEASMLHFFLGVHLQNALGLPKSNPKLLADCRVTNANEASELILTKLWLKLNGRN